MECWVGKGSSLWVARCITYPSPRNLIRHLDVYLTTRERNKCSLSMVIELSWGHLHLNGELDQRGDQDGKQANVNCLLELGVSAAGTKPLAQSGNWPLLCGSQSPSLENGGVMILCSGLPGGNEIQVRR